MYFFVILPYHLDMEHIDLSHTIHTDMPVYPGTEPPRITDICSLQDDGFAEKLLDIYSHTGTHIDAPAHMLEEGRHLDDFPVSAFIGPALVISCTSPVITQALIEAALESCLSPEFLLFHTSWDRYWGRETYFTGYPVLSAEAARFIAGLGVKAVGFDTISADAADTQDYPIHRILLGSEILIIENLTRLSRLQGTAFTFSALPMKILHSDGSPIRAVAYS